MTQNDIKKELYKQKPVAYFRMATKLGLYYTADLIENVIGLDSDFNVNFFIPFSDMGETSFFTNMKSQLLIRYLVVKE